MQLFIEMSNLFIEMSNLFNHFWWFTESERATIVHHYPVPLPTCELRRPNYKICIRTCIHYICLYFDHIAKKSSRCAMNSESCLDLEMVAKLKQGILVSLNGSNIKDKLQAWKMGVKIRGALPSLPDKVSSIKEQTKYVLCIASSCITWFFFD